MATTIFLQGITCPNCRHTFMIPGSDAVGGTGDRINVVASGSVLRCPSCGSVFSPTDTQTSLRSPTDIILIVSAALLGIGLGYALLSFLGFNLPFAFFR